MPNYHLKLQQIACQRGDNLLFDNLNWDFHSGDWVQIDGENGIGKTSLLRILTGLSQPLSGKVYWNAVQITQIREQFHQNLLYLGHQAGIKPELTAWDNLQFYQRIQGKNSPEQLWTVLEKVGLLGYEDITASLLSSGQQRRIALARLWLSQVPLWVLDEPFTALDKQGVQQLADLFEQHCAKGGIIILTSHQAIDCPNLTKLYLAEYRQQ